MFFQQYRFITPCLNPGCNACEGSYRLPRMRPCSRWPGAAGSRPGHNTACAIPVKHMATADMNSAINLALKRPLFNQRYHCFSLAMLAPIPPLPTPSKITTAETAALAPARIPQARSAASTAGSPASILKRRVWTMTMSRSTCSRRALGSEESVIISLAL